MRDWRNNRDNGSSGNEHSGSLVATVDGEDGAEPRAHRPSLAALLTEAGLVTDEQVKEALEEGTRNGERLGEVLIRREIVGEEQLAELLAAQWELPFLRSDSLAVDSLAVRELKAADARRLIALPVRFEQVGGGMQRLMVAVAEPSEDRFASVRELLSGATVDFVVVSRSALDRLLNSRLVGGDDAATEAPADTDASVEAETTAEEETIEAETAPVEAEAEAEAEPQAEAPVAEHAVPDIAAVVEALEQATARLRSIDDDVETLSSALRETEERLAEKTRLLAAAEAAIERDRVTISGLEGELAQQGDLFGALKAKVAELNRTLESAP